MINIHYTEAAKLMLNRIKTKADCRVIAITNSFDKENKLWVVFSKFANKKTVAIFRIKPKS